MYLLGYDIGSSSIKASLLNAETGKLAASASSPEKEMEMISRQTGWAEQNPQIWWDNLIAATKKLLLKTKINPLNIKAIGISYQMHGLVLVDKNQKVLRDSIIWCDSRAVDIGNKAFKNLGQTFCLANFLNSPGNFTASKLRWVKENEPAIYAKIFRIMLPGDYIAMRMTNLINTTQTGLSEGIMWNFKKQKIAREILKHYGIPASLLPEIVPVFAKQGELSKQAAEELGLHRGTLISYRAGDQPNNAFSLNVLEPGEAAANAGTSGVIYGISDQKKYDPESRINTFLHVNHSEKKARYGVLLCLNGTGIFYRWLKNNLSLNYSSQSYQQMNKLTDKSPLGAKGILAFPFGNGAERILGNKDIGAQYINLRFNTHGLQDIIRATQEGIIFSLRYGLDIMKKVGVKITTFKAGNTNMFLSPVFRQTFANVTNSDLELYDTDGSQGAARGAGLGAGIFNNKKEAFRGLNSVILVQPNKNVGKYEEIYQKWRKYLEQIINF